MGRELTEALARTQEESAPEPGARRAARHDRPRRGAEPDAGRGRRAPGVDAALVDVLGPDGEPVTTGGRDHARGGRGVLRRPRAAGGKIRSLILDFGDGGRTAARRRGPPILAGLAVPVHGELETLGLLSVFSRSRAAASTTSCSPRSRRSRCAPARRSRTRGASARRASQADLDALTGLHNRRYFHETLAREIARAQRYNRQPRADRLRPRRLQGDQRPDRPPRRRRRAGGGRRARPRGRPPRRHRLPRRRRRVRGDPPRVDARRRRAALPPDPVRGLVAADLARRAAPALGRHRRARPQDDPVAFFQRADDALYRAKEGGKGRVASERRASAPRRASPGGRRAARIFGVQGRPGSLELRGRGPARMRQLRQATRTDSARSRDR